MKLIFENWRRFLKEEPAAFHGFDMTPQNMRIEPCDTAPEDEEHGYSDNQWEAGEKGCPQFSNDRGIASDHPDIQQAIQFLDNVRPSELIAYSRGGAIALAALPSATHQPYVTFIAPAWKRGWVNGIENPTFSNGIIMHGTKDDKVPLSHSVELSDLTGMSLHVFDGLGHINILKHKLNPESGKLWQDFSQEEKDELMSGDIKIITKDKKAN
tara:strand:- start:4561 stop:5196 length:636 start_codon:yes stop_codon:yes gene_type:complete